MRLLFARAPLASVSSLPLLALAAASLAVGCSSSSQATPNGPTFGDASGADVATDHVPPDAGHKADTGGTQTHMDASDAHSHDAHTGKDVTVPPPVDSGRDATSIDAGLDAGFDAGFDAGSPLVDSGHDAGTAPETGTPVHVCPSGTGTLAIIGGSSTYAFGAASTNGAAFVVTPFASLSVGSAPAILPFGAGALALFPESGTIDIESTSFSAGATPPWSTPVTVPELMGSDAAATELGSPALAAVGLNAELVYQGSNNKFYHGVYSGSWGPASDPVQATGKAQEYGPSYPAAAAAGATMYVAYDGGDNGLYVETWTQATGWGGANGIMGAGVGTVAPTLVALSGGTADVMLVFEQKTTNILYSVVHTPGATPAWSAPVTIAGNASTTSQASVAALPTGGAVMTFLGVTDSLPYFSIYSPTASTKWSAPAAILSGTTALASAPTVSSAGGAGVCGLDAVAALVEPSGVQVVGLKSGAWGSPAAISGTASMKYATIAGF